MNDIKLQIKEAFVKSLDGFLPLEEKIPSIELEIPAQKAFGDYSCNIAMKLAKILKKSPLECAKQITSILEKNLPTSVLVNRIAKIEIKNPGFINFFIAPNALFDVIEEVFISDENYGRSDRGQKTKIQLEFVSANPTGPLSVAHARQAAVGDALGNILRFVGYDAIKEFYVNDEGNQINILGRSINLRSQEILTGSVVFPDDHYQGDYIKDMAQIFLDKFDIKTIDALNALDECVPRQFGVDFLLNVIKQELVDFGVNFDVWSHQSVIATEANIKSVLQFLQDKGCLYEKDGALWFRTTEYGDDKDRVVRKSDGQYTYLTPDIVYHKYKFERGFKRVINMWGPDHHGYIPRIKASVQALGYDPKQLDVLIVQLATIYRNGEVLSMSTRKGQYISLREVMEEVGVDAARFFYLMRHTDAHLEFDLDLAKKQSMENPVYYIQYAHARVFSINKKALDLKISIHTQRFSLLNSKEELELIKSLAFFNEVLGFCEVKLDPFPLVNYLQELATAFHRFYDMHRVIDEANPELSSQRLGLSNATRIVLRNGLRLLGVSQPEQM